MNYDQEIEQRHHPENFDGMCSICGDLQDPEHDCSDQAWCECGNQKPVGNMVCSDCR